MVELLKFSFLVFLCWMDTTRGAPIERVMIDMTYVYDEHTQNFPMWKKLEMTVVVNGTVGDTDVWFQGEEITTATHAGTHMDAPSHFIPGGLNVDQISMSHFIAPAAVINIAKKAQEDPDAEVLVKDLEAWEEITGQTLDDKIVLVNSGWGDKWHNRTAFIGTPEEDISKLHFPGISPEAAQWMVDNRKIHGVGIDTLSFDKGSSAEYMSHRILLGAGLFGLENIANVDKIPIYGAKLYVMPMKIAHASGAPTRVIATFPKIIFDH